MVPGAPRSSAHLRLHSWLLRDAVRPCPALVVPLVSPATAPSRSCGCSRENRAGPGRARLVSRAQGGDCGQGEGVRRGGGWGCHLGWPRGDCKPARARPLPLLGRVGGRSASRSPAPWRTRGRSCCQLRWVRVGVGGTRSAAEASDTRCQVSDCRPQGSPLPAPGLSFPCGSSCRCPGNLSPFRVVRGRGWRRAGRAPGGAGEGSFCLVLQARRRLRGTPQALFQQGRR